jgi:serine/threonine protein kinase
VLVRRGGGVPFADKVANAGLAGAIGVIIINNRDCTEEYALGDPSKDIRPSMLISQSAGEAVLELLVTSEITEDFTTASSSTQPPPPATSRWQCMAEVRTDAEHEVAMCRRIPPHPQVIKILDTWDEGDTPVVVTEICTGGTLLRNPSYDVKGLDTTAALSLLKQLLAGISHLHANGICHRDLKKENMLMTRPFGHPDARLVLIDFSMASLTPNMSVPCGSARYLAPEVVNDGHYGTPRDIWAAGVIGYELLWGMYPFGYDFTPDADVIKAICSAAPVQVPPPPSGSSLVRRVPELACEVVRALLQKDPALRPTAAEALMHPVFKDISLPGFGKSEKVCK